MNESRKTPTLIVLLVLAVLAILTFWLLRPKDTSSQLPSPDKTVGINENPIKEPTPEATDPKDDPKEPIKNDITPDMRYQPELPGEENVGAKELIALGQKVDDAMASLKNARGLGILQYDYIGNQMRSSLETKIQDQKTYKINFVLPRTLGSANQIIADGEDRVLKIDGKYEPLPGFGSTNQDLTAMSHAELEKWAEEFPLYIFAHFTGGQASWEGLMRGFASQDSGFDVTVHKGTIKVNNKDRPMYMLTAESLADTKTSIQIKVDGVRYLPLTIKVDKQVEGGNLKMFWNSGWAFSDDPADRYDKSEFVIPTKFR